MMLWWKADWSSDHFFGIFLFLLIISALLTPVSNLLFLFFLISVTLPFLLVDFFTFYPFSHPLSSGCSLFLHMAASASGVFCMCQHQQSAERSLGLQLNQVCHSPWFAFPHNLSFSRLGTIFTSHQDVQIKTESASFYGDKSNSIDFSCSYSTLISKHFIKKIKKAELHFKIIHRFYYLI